MLSWNGGSNAPMLKKMKYLILVDTVANGKKVRVGDVVELNQQEGNILIGYNKASVHVEKKSEQKDRSIGLEKSEAPKVSKRTAKK